MSRYLLGAVAHTLRSGSVALTQRLILNRAIKFSRALLKFYMYSRHKLHEDTAGFTEDALRRFHDTKGSFGWTGRHTGAFKASILRTELVRKRKAEGERCPLRLLKIHIMSHFT